MLLTQGEAEILHEYVVPFRSGTATGRGTLFLTDRRLILEQVPHGFLSSASPHTVLNVSLHQLVNAGPGPGRRRPKALHVELDASKWTLFVADPVKWSKSIASAKASLRHPSDGSRPTLFVHVAPSHGTTHTVERHVVKVRCRYCGSLSDELTSRCPSCGAPL